MDALSRGNIEKVYQKWENSGPAGEKTNRARGSNGYQHHRNSNTNYSRLNGRNGFGNHRNGSTFGEPRKARYKERLERESQQLTFASYTPKGFVPSLGFDLSEANQTYAHKCLSLHTCCSRCLPASKSKFVNSDQAGAPLYDVLLLPRHSVRGLLGSLCPTLVFTLTNPIISPLTDPRNRSITSPRVNSAIHEAALAAVSTAKEEQKDLNLAERRQRRRANLILSSISGSVYKWLLRVSNYTLHWVFWKLFGQLHIQSSHIDMLLQAQQRDVPIVFLPSHKSHLDYILLTFVLLNVGIKVPHIAAGDNLNIPVFNWLIRHLGGWFIRRKLDNGHGRDGLYRSCLHEYMEQLIKDNQNIEFYVEGSRSRTGKPALPKGGLLSVLVEAIREGIVDDILIAPTSVAYDRILERNFIRHELLGGSKRPENFLKGLKGVWSMLTMNIGCVRMDFAQPFSLKEYIYKHQTSKYSLMDLSLQSAVPTSPYTPTTHSSSSDRQLVNALGYHVVYDFTCCAPVMATNIIGFLLLTKFRNGVTISDLTVSYKWMVDRITSWGRPIGCSYVPSEAVHYSLAFLNHLIFTKRVPCEQQQKDGSQTIDLIAPRLELPDVFELLHHTNQLSVGFVKDSLIACSIAILMEGEEYSRDNDGDDNSDVGKVQSSSIKLSQSELSDKALELAKIFAREFVYAPPCVDISTALFEGIESLKRMEVIKDVTPSSIDRFSGRRLKSMLADTWSDEEDNDEQMIEINHSTESRDYLKFLRCILGPYIEGYWSCAMHLKSVFKDESSEQHSFDENNFLRDLQQSMTDKASKGSLYFIESCSSDILRNSLKSFIGMEIISLDQEGNLLIADEQKLHDILDSLSVCKL